MGTNINKKIAVIGGSGFLGKSLLKLLLNENAEIIIQGKIINNIKRILIQNFILKITIPLKKMIDFLEVLVKKILKTT
mgnify:CR=1 FL=1